jgi:hypothetical protein
MSLPPLHLHSIHSQDKDNHLRQGQTGHAPY